MTVLWARRVEIGVTSFGVWKALVLQNLIGDGHYIFFNCRRRRCFIVLAMSFYKEIAEDYVSRMKKEYLQECCEEHT